MILYITADGHIGNHGKNGGPVTGGINERCQHSLDAFRRVNARAQEDAMSSTGPYGGAAHIHLGDLFDYVRVEPQIEAAVQQSIEDADQVDFAMVVGNHDQKSTAKGDHAMAPLASVGVTIVEDVPVWKGYDSVQFLFIPFQEGNADEWLPREVERGLQLRPPGSGDTLVLGFHLGVSDRDTSYFLDGADDSVSLDLVGGLAAKYGFQYVFAGNWHKHEWWTLGDEEVEVVQIGTLAPNRFTDHGGRYGCAVRFDTEEESIEVIDIPGPRFVKVAACDTFSAVENLKEFLDDPSRGDLRDISLARPLYVSVQVPAADVERAEEMLQHAKECGAAGRLRAYEVHSDPKERQAAVAEAVAVATSAASKEEALAGYIEKTPTEVDRAALSSFVNSCIKEARG
jgi:DNA repair exonuclease SbcCD nuclease subunit